ncbi:MAG: hypothetical protein J7474_08105, partial [Arthrobacter sp.]|nr:hypothetical protein [Arthrobacter sp.]
VRDHKPKRVVMVTECSMADNVQAELPQIEFVKKGLANYGPTLFANQATDTHVPDWTTVGWEKGSTHK